MNPSEKNKIVRPLSPQFKARVHNSSSDCRIHLCTASQQEKPYRRSTASQTLRVVLQRVSSHATHLANEMSSAQHWSTELRVCTSAPPETLRGGASPSRTLHMGVRHEAPVELAG